MKCMPTCLSEKEGIYDIDYVPKQNDCIIGTIVQDFKDTYIVDINSTYKGRLPTLAFDGATKVNKPKLVVFCV